MGVYIKGMKMPKCCEECWDINLHVAIDCDNFGSGDELSPTCPLIEVKAPHGRLKDESVIVVNLMEYSKGNKTIGQCLDEAPTVIEAEVE